MNNLISYKKFLPPLVLFFLLIVYIPNLPAAVPQKLKVHFLNVGYGDSALIELPGGKTLMIDAGDAVSADRVLDYLKARKIERLDEVIITHPHKNHFGGLELISDYVPIGNVYVNGDTADEDEYLKLLNKLKDKGIAIKTLARGMALKPEAYVTLEVLNPARLSHSVNENSIVCWLKYKKKSVLFMSDASLNRLTPLPPKYAGIADSDCVTVPHHGVNVSEDFMGFFNDKIFIISSAIQEPWLIAYPSEWDRLDGQVFITESGTVILESDGETVRVSQQEGP